MKRAFQVPIVPEIPGLAEYVDLAMLYASPSFRIRHWRCLHDGQVLRDERANEHDVLSVVDHGAFVHHKGRAEALVDPTCVVLNRAWQPYRTSHPFGCGDDGFHVAMHREVLREACAGRRLHRGFGLARAAGHSLAVLRQRVLVRRLRRGLAVDELEVEENLFAMLAEVLDELMPPGRAPRSSGPAPRHHERVCEAVRSLLYGSFREALKLDDIARAVHVSPYHLCRVFKHTAGETIHQYRNRLRLLEALEPAAEPGTDLTELALELGYSSHSHFTASFRRLFGLTPSQLRDAASRQTLKAWKKAVVKPK